MKYMLLIYGNEATGISPDSPDFAPYMAAYQVASDTYVKGGAMVAGEALEPTASATSVRVRNGKTQTTDGPFAETKEQLGGFYILECANLDEAIRYAAMIPDAQSGTVEIRPVMDLSGMGG